MGLLGELFRGNPNKIEDTEEADEIDYFLDDEETLMFGQYIALDITFDSDEDDDDDLFIPEYYSADTDEDITDLEIGESDAESPPENEEDSSQESDMEEADVVDKKVNDNSVKSSENFDSNPSQA